MKGCINCGSYDRGEYGKPGRCISGHDEAFRRWWIENGDKRETDKIQNMDCFTPTTVSRLLDDALATLGEMETIIDSHEKKKAIDLQSLVDDFENVFICTVSSVAEKNGIIEIEFENAFASGIVRVKSVSDAKELCRQQREYHKTR